MCWKSKRNQCTRCFPLRVNYLRLMKRCVAAPSETSMRGRKAAEATLFLDATEVVARFLNIASRP